MRRDVLPDTRPAGGIRLLTSSPLKDEDSSPLTYAERRASWGSRFTGPPTRSLPAQSPHALRRCSLPRSRPRCRCSAGGAGEDRLALAVLTRHVPARAAALAGVRGVDLLDPAGGLVFQPADQDAPAGSEDLPVQPGLGAHIAAGFARCPSPSGSCRALAGPRPGSRRSAAPGRWTASRPSPCARRPRGLSASRSRT